MACLAADPVLMLSPLPGLPRSWYRPISHCVRRFRARRARKKPIRQRSLCRRCSVAPPIGARRKRERLMQPGSHAPIQAFVRPPAIRIRLSPTRVQQRVMSLPPPPAKARARAQPRRTRKQVLPAWRKRGLCRGEPPWSLPGRLSSCQKLTPILPTMPPLLAFLPLGVMNVASVSTYWTPSEIAL